jgi:hypothetical protein
MKQLFIPLNSELPKLFPATRKKEETFPKKLDRIFYLGKTQ